MGQRRVRKKAEVTLEGRRVRAQATDTEREKNKNERWEATDCKEGSLYKCKVEHVAELLTQLLVQ